MAQDPGGGTGSDLCQITPSDLAGNVDNLINRVVALEQIVGQLLGVDVSADQLSDISQDLGWITGVTFLGVEGWTQTPSGTLIPPPGWTGLSDIIDGDAGLRIYGGAVSNVLYRAAPDLSVTTSTPDFMEFSVLSAGIQFDFGNYFRYPSNIDGNDGIDVTADGIYRVTVDCVLDWSLASTPTSGNVETSLRRKRVASTITQLFHYVEPPVLGDDVLGINLTMVRRYLADDVIKFYISNGTDQNLVATGGNISLERLRGL